VSWATFFAPLRFCDEVHFIDENIVLKQTPVLALGSYTYSDWTEVALTGGALGEVNTELCILDTDLPADFSIGDIEFKYPVAIDEIYGYDQCLQSPNPVYQVDCDGLGNPGWKFTWQQYQLIPPDRIRLSRRATRPSLSSLCSGAQKALTRLRPCRPLRWTRTALRPTDSGAC
jgi:hypothetical protein